MTTLDRPASAPQTGDYDFGYHVIASPTFAAGITAAATIFCSGAGTSAFLPVMSEMRNPKEYSKAVNVCMGLVTAAYLSFSLVVYKYCGKWVASPSLGSAGPMVKKVAYGIGLIGLCVSGALYVHVSAKYVFVRILRKSRHLQANTFVHWGTWFGCVATMAIISFLIASGVPIFNYLLSLAGSIAFAPLALGLPGWLWIYVSFNKSSLENCTDLQPGPCRLLARQPLEENPVRTAHHFDRDLCLHDHRWNLWSHCANHGRLQGWVH